MSKMSDLSKLSNMRISIDIPDEWGKPLKKAAIDAGAQSVADFLRKYIQETIKADPVSNSWGGKRRVKQDEQVTQDTHVEQDDGSTTKPEPPKTVAATPVPPEVKSIIEQLNPMLEKVAREQEKIARKTINTKPVEIMTENMTPAQKLAARKEAARAKFDKPKPLNGKG